MGYIVLAWSLYDGFHRGMILALHTSGEGAFKVNDVP
jgi:hypothetical protein